MVDKKTSQKFKLQSMNKTKTYLIEEIKQNKLIRKKTQKILDGFRLY